MAFISQQVEISTGEASDLVLEIHKKMEEPTSPGQRITLFEAYAYPALGSAGRKLYRRILKARPGTTLKITFSAYELIAINQLINNFPVNLFNILSQIDRKVQIYDHIIEF